MHRHDIQLFTLIIPRHTTRWKSQANFALHRSRKNNFMEDNLAKRTAKPRKPISTTVRQGGRVVNVVADRLDLRDRKYMPPVAQAPTPMLYPALRLPVLNQHQTSACTGYSLAVVIHSLKLKAYRDLFKREARANEVPQFSPHMLYSMARRYDEFRGSESDTGSSLRGALKGWFRHGACEMSMWPNSVPVNRMPKPQPDPDKDWWQNAIKCRLGAYYRIEKRSISDMHVALSDVGILYASAICHDGWNDPFHDKSDDSYTIRHQQPHPDDGGHAFAIVGYDQHGFIIQNSWGTEWGNQGLARLTYEDWLENAMDCWVAQLGVVTTEHLEIAKAASLRVDEKGRVRVSSEQRTRDRELSPFIVNVENNGQLSRSGRFRTQPSDIEALLGLQVDEAAKAWGLKANEAIDIAIYAHGGLTGEDTAAKTAEMWIKALYENHVLPMFFMWETDIWSTFRNMLSEALRGQPRPTGDIGDWFRDKIEQLDDRKDERLEGLLARPGTAVWDEMKENATLISHGSDECAGKLVYQYAKTSPSLKNRPYRVHLVGHSAGAIVHSNVIDTLCRRGWEFESVSFLAPAATVDLFREKALPWIEKKKVKRYAQFHLLDEAERDDNTCRPVLGYGKSLLYLVSNSFEGGKRTPILGMQKYYDEYIKPMGLGNVAAHAAPSGKSQSSTHGGFDDDERTLRTVIQTIKGN